MRRLITTLMLFLASSTIYAEFRNLSIMAGPAAIGSPKKLDSTWGAFGPTVDFVFPLSNDEISPTLGFRIDPLLIINSIQGKVGVVLNQNQRINYIAEFGCGAMVGIMDVVQVFPVYDTSFIVRQYPDRESNFEIEYGIRANFTIYPFQFGTIITIPFGIVF